MLQKPEFSLPSMTLTIYKLNYILCYKMFNQVKKAIKTIFRFALK